MCVCVCVYLCVCVIINGPKIQHADKLYKRIKQTIYSMHGVGKWYFAQASTATKLKFYHASEAVDNLQNVDMDSTFFSRLCLFP